MLKILSSSLLVAPVGCVVLASKNELSSFIQPIDLGGDTLPSGYTHLNGNKVRNPDGREGYVKKVDGRLLLVDASNGVIEDLDRVWKVHWRRFNKWFEETFPHPGSDDPWDGYPNGLSFVQTNDSSTSFSQSNPKKKQPKEWPLLEPKSPSKQPIRRPPTPPSSPRRQGLSDLFAFYKNKLANAPRAESPPGYYGDSGLPSFVQTADDSKRLVESSQQP